MNTDRQIIKDIENKHAQAREEYAKNKTRMSEYKTKEKSTNFIHPDKPESKENLTGKKK